MHYISMPLLVVMGLIGCAEVPRATSGFQVLTIDPDPMGSEVSWRPSQSSRVVYYGHIQDQDGAPVADATVMFKLSRGEKSKMDGTPPPSTEWLVRTNSDNAGNFSVVGGRGHAWVCRVVKKGYTPLELLCYLDRNNSITAYRRACASPATPERMVLWRNTGFDHKRLIGYRPAKFFIPWPYITNNPYAATRWYIVSKPPSRSFLAIAPLRLARSGSGSMTAPSRPA